MKEVTENANFGQTAVNAMLLTPVKQVEILSNNIAYGLGVMGGQAVLILIDNIKLLNESFSNDEIQKFFKMFGDALYIITAI
ncbi:hypothetical protein, partial [Paenibacillus sp. 2TAB19]|uniref:hypothetical protein n=1 Tax=Paenibacillus sp. 2TAB19 TaxID=3233003 RepID=UPI003F9C750E